MTQQDVHQFQELFSLHFGQGLTEAEATEKLIALLTIMRIVYKPITEKQLGEIQQWRKRRRDLKDN